MKVKCNGCGREVLLIDMLMHDFRCEWHGYRTANGWDKCTHAADRCYSNVETEGAEVAR
ncbi:hypothetical protein [Microbacterium sp. A1-JK]|uniref:hypothetical protein n=1 Tax=Microbacterium sp. A1-JK TaxID=3177516 RepID=UPI00388A551C